MREGDDKTTRRWQRLGACTLFIGCAALYAWTGMRPEFNGLLSDSYVYLAAAAALGHDPSLLAHIAAVYPFPPLFPLSLGLAGGGSSSPAQSYLFGAVVLAGVVVLFLRWLRAEGVAPVPAALAALVFAMLPASLQTAMGILSEPLFMLCVTGAMLALSRDAPRGWWLAALLVAAASLTRSVGVAAIAAFVVHWGIRRGWRRARAAPLLAAAPFVLWTLGKQWLGWNDYTVGAVAQYDAFALLAANAEAWRVYAVKGVDLLMRQHTAVVLAVLGAIALATWAMRLRRGRFDALYVGAYLAIMAIWPYPHHAGRFLYVLLPIALAYAVFGAQSLSRRWPTLPAVQAAVAALVPLGVLAVALPSTTTMLAGLWRHPDPPLASAMRAPSWYEAAPSAALRSARFEQRLVEFQRRALPLLPSAACVASVIPQQVLTYGARRGVDLTQVRARGRTLEETFAECPYVLMIAARPYPPVKGVGSLFPLEVIRDRLEVIALERDRPDDPGSALVAMLARVR